MTLAQKVKTYQLKGTFQHSVDFLLIFYFILFFYFIFLDFLFID